MVITMVDTCVADKHAKQGPVAFIAALFLKPPVETRSELADMYGMSAVCSHMNIFFSASAPDQRILCLVVVAGNVQKIRRYLKGAQFALQ